MQHHSNIYIYIYIYDHYKFIDFQNKNKTIYILAQECPGYIITQRVYYASKTQCDLIHKIILPLLIFLVVYEFFRGNVVLSGC